jgi:type IV pilus assembly protein PilM
MAKKRSLGFDIGTSFMKFALCEDGIPTGGAAVEVPRDLVKDGRITSFAAMGDFIKEQLDEKGIRIRQCAVALPSDQCYIRHVRMPQMTIKQLMLNIPYEFHEFITEDMNGYLYDYAVLSKEEKELDLLLVAAKKKLLDDYKEMFRRAKLKLVSIVPEELAYSRIMRRKAKSGPEPDQKKDYVILDLGHSALQVHFFQKGIYEVTRQLEPGCSAVLKLLSDSTGADTHSVILRRESGTFRGEGVS